MKKYLFCTFFKYKLNNFQKKKQMHAIIEESKLSGKRYQLCVSMIHWTDICKLICDDLLHYIYVFLTLITVWVGRKRITFSFIMKYIFKRIFFNDYWINKTMFFISIVTVLHFEWILWFNTCQFDLRFIEKKCVLGIVFHFCVGWGMVFCLYILDCDNVFLKGDEIFKR